MRNETNDSLPPIPPPSAEEIHNLSCRTTAPRVIRVRRSIPVVRLLLVGLRELAVVLDEHATSADLPALSLWCLPPAIIVLVETGWVAASAVLGVIERGLGFGCESGFALAEVHRRKKLWGCAGAGVRDRLGDVALLDGA